MDASTRPFAASKPIRLTFELTNICNLHCSYCGRDDEALYHSSAHFFHAALLRRIIRDARRDFEIAEVCFTGGEVTLHPQFNEIIEALAAENLKVEFVTNGWHFERIYRVVRTHHQTIGTISFSLDGATKDAHDRWRGAGSFVRIIRAVSLCRANEIPFAFKVILRRDTVSDLEQIALFAARLGARGLNFEYLLPTSSKFEDDWMPSIAERKQAEMEIGALARIFKMPIGLGPGRINTDPSSPCAPLSGRSCNIDYLGRLTLCCNLSGFRGGASETDVAADLNHENFTAAFNRLRSLAEAQVRKRSEALALYKESNREVDLFTSSPCLFCLHSFGKIPWHQPAHGDSKSLPILAAS